MPNSTASKRTPIHTWTTDHCIIHEMSYPRFHNTFDITDREGHWLGQIISFSAENQARYQNDLNAGACPICDRWSTDQEWCTMNGWGDPHPIPGQHAVFREEDWGYSGCVNQQNCDPFAHGNITRTEHCRCGAKRLTNINGGDEESSGWLFPKR